MATDKELLENTQDFLSSDRNKSTVNQILDFQGNLIKIGNVYFIRTIVDKKFEQQRIIGNVIAYMQKRKMDPIKCMLIPQSFFETEKTKKQYLGLRGEPR